jgi:hypothetical protein
MMEPARGRPSSWESIGETSNSKYFLASGESDIVIVAPHADAFDDGPSALENVAFQMDYARSLGRPCAFVVLLGKLRSQEPAARRAYAEGMDPARCFASALVVSNVLSRAIASFFLGITRPMTPTRVFDSIEAAIAWAVSMRPSQP